MGPVRDRPDDGDVEPGSRPRHGREGRDGGDGREGRVYVASNTPSELARAAGDSFAPEEAKSGEIDARAHAAWRSWLGALASDVSAAMAAALAYESLPGPARDAWLQALEDDAPRVSVPRVALYAPLLAVEADDARRARITRALDGSRDGGEAPARGPAAHALRGTMADGRRACIVVSPLYLDFVELLVCCYDDAGIFSARHEPLSHLREGRVIPEVEGVSLELTPLAVVVEDLAHALLADRRAGREPPQALGQFIHIFAPSLGGGEEE